MKNSELHKWHEHLMGKHILPLKKQPFLISTILFFEKNYVFIKLKISILVKELFANQSILSLTGQFIIFHHLHISDENFAAFS